MCELKLNCRTGNKKDRRVLRKNKQMKLVLPCVEFVYSLVRLLSSHITFDFSLVLSWDNEAVVSRFFITTLFSPNVKIYIDRGYHGNQQSWFISTAFNYQCNQPVANMLCFLCSFCNGTNVRNTPRSVIFRLHFRGNFSVTDVFHPPLCKQVLCQ